MRQLLNLPNVLTLARIGLTPLFLVLLFAEPWYWKGLSFVVFAVASLTDFYDGHLARTGGRETAVGRFLDPLADKILVTSALVAFAVGRMVHYWLIVPVIVRDVAITGLRIYGLYRGRHMVTSRLAKWKTAFQLFSVVVILFAIGLEAYLGRADGAMAAGPGETVRLLSNALMGAVLVLTVASGVHYLFGASFYDTDTK